MKVKHFNFGIYSLNDEKIQFWMLDNFIPHIKKGIVNKINNQTQILSPDRIFNGKKS